MKKVYFLLLALAMGITINAQIINFPDANFKAKLIAQGFDSNSDGQISQAEALVPVSLLVSSINVTNVSGIEFFTNLTSVSIYYTNLTSLDLSLFSGMTNLQYLNCANNHIQSLDLSGLNNLTHLGIFACDHNNLITINTSGSNLPNLQHFDCGNNQLTNLNVSNFPLLSDFYCNSNNLTDLTILNCPALLNVVCDQNQLTNLNISNCVLLNFVRCENNPLVSIDFSHLPNLLTLLVRNNPLLTSVNIKNGHGAKLDFSNGNTSLKYLCCDESVAAYHQNQNNIFLLTPLPNFSINSYCSFVPGGTFYTIQGDVKYDLNANGCDALDFTLPNMKYSINNGTITGVLFANTSGNYSIPVQAGTHTITPVLENPSYFTISPANLVVTFPTQISPFMQNFCVAANGSYSDLEVSILPITRARPGFDASYKLIYKNKGNTTQSGTVNLTFNDAVLDFVSANPAVSNQGTNSLSWDFIDLVPFETREIVFTLNVNSPSETPAVNGGDILTYTGAITSEASDETPTDNIFTLNQTVVNAYDPNDKTCLEGTTIAPDKVGDYVHYMIRFENTGTFPAENIVVKDMIDAAKFNVNSLVPIKGSHNYVTRIDGNKVEFIFENINLPFDNANNDGYVAFKIKTKPTLVNGDTFSNSASIYFDYNFPIVTNTATTTIQALSVQDFNFSTYFSLYPNPVHDVLTISTKENIEVSSINIYNTLGQLILVIPNAKNTKTVDVSSLTSGNYFIKINSDKGTSNTKFIKN